MIKHKVYTDAEKKELVLNLLKEKYGEEFVGISYAPRQWGQSYDLYFVFPKSGTKDDFFQVFGFKTDDGGYRITDNYFGVLIHDEYEAFVRSVVEKEFSEYKLKIKMQNNSTHSDFYTKETTLDEIYDLGIKNKGGQDPLVLFTPEVILCVKKSSAADMDVKAAIMRIMQGMANKKLTCILQLFVMKDAQYNAVPEGDFPVFTPENKVTRYEVMHGSDLKIGEIIENK